MTALVIGGAASGKSAFAEQLAVSLSDGPRCYIATMQPFDDECRARIQRHREQRAGKGFATLECFTGLHRAVPPEKSTVLLECVSNLAANELYSPDGAGDGAVEAIVEGVRSLRRRCEHLVIVSNEVFSGGSSYAGDTLHYLRVLAQVNRLLAQEADEVYEIVCGLPICHKGKGVGA